MPGKLVSAGLLLWVLLSSFGAAADDMVNAKTKATYVFNFTKFVEWPALMNDTLHVCIVGAEPIVNLLSELASRDTKGHLLQIWSGIDDPQICQILYIDHDAPELPALIQQVRGNQILTVSDAEGFAGRGGCIGFYSENGQIKLEINPDAVRRAQLKVNALLMEIARIVR
ncbi:YfiR family protein [Methylomonas sp. TEB]|uniref:YfiR family protein n=1 Tax=Methylomonas sp. TEB TaxID=3398229 RepID=UPI0039F63C0C